MCRSCGIIYPPDYDVFAIWVVLNDDAYTLAMKNVKGMGTKFYEVSDVHDWFTREIVGTPPLVVM